MAIAVNDSNFEEVVLLKKSLKNLQEKLPLLRLTSTAAQAQQLNSVSVTSRLSCSLKTVKLLINK